MSFIMMLARWWDDRGTGILGTAQFIVAGIIAIPNAIPESRAKYWAIAGVVLAGLTVRRSNENKKKLTDVLQPPSNPPAAP